MEMPINFFFWRPFFQFEPSDEATTSTLGRSFCSSRMEDASIEITVPFRKSLFLCFLFTIIV